jgi:integrase
MYQKQLIRPIPVSGRVVGDSVEFMRKGKMIKRKLTKDGSMMIDLSVSYYAKIKRADETTVEVKLANNKKRAERRLEDIEENQALIERGLAPANYDPDQDLLGLHKLYVVEKANDGLVDMERIKTVAPTIFAKLGARSIEDILNPSFPKSLSRYVRMLQTTPKRSFIIPDMDLIPIQVVRDDMLKVSDSTMYARFRRMGIEPTRTGGLSFLTQNDLHALAAAMFKPLAPNTINNQISHLKDFFKWLCDNEYINEIPRMPKRMDRSKDRRKVRRVLSWDQCLSLCDSVVKLNRTRGNLTAQARSILYKIAFTTMVRRRALAELMVKDVIYKEDRILISIRPETDKVKKGRLIDLPVCLHEEFKEYIKDKQPGDWVFGYKRKLQKNEHPKKEVPGCLNTIHWCLQLDLPEAGIPYKTPEGDIDFHAFRHSGATHYVTKEVPLHKIQYIGGWTTLRMLVEVYSHLRGEDVYGSINSCF